MPMTGAERSEENRDGTGMATVVDRNIAALLAHRQEAEKQKTSQERVADAITRFTGSLYFVYLHLAFFGLWIVINLGYVPFFRPFDPTFVVLAMVASVEAIFLSTFVLISQNRAQAMADKTADLALDISLLGEHEVTRIMGLVTAIAGRMGIDESRNPELEELSKDVAPEKVLDRMNEVERAKEDDREKGQSPGTKKQEK